ncbi:hypothetical protein BaRGS_00030801 [Batillaria attramentaria]|uniref:Secreted protein n=1 Tax=Batillaria attramentaria TaxID=370345 RepID=A0ABD0JSV7_9CAEN
MLARLGALAGRRGFFLSVLAELSVMVQGTPDSGPGREKKYHLGQSSSALLPFHIHLVSYHTPTQDEASDPMYQKRNLPQSPAV